jgi:hypothetical protein
VLLLAERKTGQACETLNKPCSLVSLGTLKNKVLFFLIECKNRMQMGKRKLERTNKRRQAQREIREQGNKTNTKAAGCPESCDVITTPAAAWALDRNVQAHWVNERAVRL